MLTAKTAFRLERRIRPLQQLQGRTSLKLESGSCEELARLDRTGEKAEPGDPWPGPLKVPG